MKGCSGPFETACDVSLKGERRRGGKKPRAFFFLHVMGAPENTPLALAMRTKKVKVGRPFEVVEGDDQCVRPAKKIII